MTEPLAVVRMNHATLEVWPDSVRTVFADGKAVPAAPNGDETLTHTAVHELLHSAIQEALTDQPSHCLRAVADGDGKRWTDQRRFEEGLAYSMTPRLVALVEALQRLV